MAKKNAGTRAIDAVLKAHSSRRREVEVPEWGLTLYFPPMTTRAQIAVAERMGDRPDKNSESYRHERNVILLINQAELEDGTQAFSYGDKEHLLDKGDFIVMQRLIGEMYAAGVRRVPQDPEEVKTSSEKTAGSGSE